MSYSCHLEGSFTDLFSSEIVGGLWGCPIVYLIVYLVYHLPTMNARAMNSAENNNSVFREMYYRLEENREEHSFWLVFILVFMWIVCPIAYGIFVYTILFIISFYLLSSQIDSAIEDVLLISEHIRPYSFRRRNRRRNQRNRELKLFRI